MMPFPEQIFKNYIQQKIIGRIFALKHAAEFFKHLTSDHLKPLGKTKSLTKSLKSSVKCLKSSSECSKSLATCLPYRMHHGVPISHNKEY